MVNTAMDPKFFIIFFFMFIGYTCVVYNRQAISYAGPVIVKEENLQNSDLGLIISSQHMGYMIVKTVAGTMADVMEPGLLFSSSLFLTGFAMASFTVASSMGVFTLIGFLCGFVQGPCWGACAVLLKRFVPAEQFGTWWGILSVSTNVAGTIGPFLSAALVGFYGWRVSFVSAASFTMALAGFCYVILRLTAEKDVKSANQGPSRKLSDILTPQLGLVFLPYTLTSIVRGACNDWGQMYLMQNKGQSALTASSFSSSCEIGGIIGSIAAGYVADKMITKDSGTVKPRYFISVIMAVILTVGVFALTFILHEQSSQLMITTVAFISGFGMYGAITLYGVLAMEVAPPNLEGTSHSAVLLGSNLGRVLAGYPLSVIATWMTWQESFITVLAISCVSLCVACLGMPYIAPKKKKA